LKEGKNVWPRGVIMSAFALVYKIINFHYLDINKLHYSVADVILVAVQLKHDNFINVNNYQLMLGMC